MTDPTDTGCEACPLAQPRRTFIRQAGMTAFGALLAIGVPHQVAATIRPRAIASRRRIGSDPSYPIPATDGVQIDKKEQVILVRWKNELYAFNLSCPHQNTALHWEDDSKRFQCPKHHSRYEPDGTFIDGRATRNMDRFSVTKSGNSVVVHVDAMHKSDADHAGWTAAAIPLTPGALPDLRRLRGNGPTHVPRGHSRRHRREWPRRVCTGGVQRAHGQSVHGKRRRLCSTRHGRRHRGRQQRLAQR